VALSEVQSVDQRMRLECGVGFANCGRAVAHVRGSYVPNKRYHALLWPRRTNKSPCNAAILFDNG
jgi:hypothetical protein